jgi:hemolysin III
LQKCDHSAIYLLIAGSYTPFTLVTLRGPWGWSLFGVSWGLAALGIVQELTLGRRTRSVSMVIYVLMGWLALVAIRPLVSALPPAGTAWLLAGGLIYSAGIYFFISASGTAMASGTCSCWAAACVNSSALRAMSREPVLRLPQ